MHDQLLRSEIEHRLQLLAEVGINMSLLRSCTRFFASPALKIRLLRSRFSTSRLQIEFVLGDHHVHTRAQLVLTRSHSSQPSTSPHPPPTALGSGLRALHLRFVPRSPQSFSE